MKTEVTDCGILLFFFFGNRVATCAGNVFPAVMHSEVPVSLFDTSSVHLDWPAMDI